jgi:hypothetical protein
MPSSSSQNSFSSVASARFSNAAAESARAGCPMCRAMASMPAREETQTPAR